MDNLTIGIIAREKAFNNLCLIIGNDPYCDQTVEVKFLSGKWKGVQVPFPKTSLKYVDKSKFLKRLYGL